MIRPAYSQSNDGTRKNRCRLRWHIVSSRKRWPTPHQFANSRTEFNLMVLACETHKRMPFTDFLQQLALNLCRRSSKPIPSSDATQFHFSTAQHQNHFAVSHCSSRIFLSQNQG